MRFCNGRGRVGYKKAGGARRGASCWDEREKNGVQKEGGRG